MVHSDEIAAMLKDTLTVIKASSKKTKYWDQIINVYEQAIDNAEKGESVWVSDAQEIFLNSSRVYRAMDKATKITNEYMWEGLGYLNSTIDHAIGSFTFVKPDNVDAKERYTKIISMLREIKEKINQDTYPRDYVALPVLKYGDREIDDYPKWDLLRDINCWYTKNYRNLEGSEGYMKVLKKDRDILLIEQYGNTYVRWMSTLWATIDHLQVKIPDYKCKEILRGKETLRNIVDFWDVPMFSPDTLKEDFVSDYLQFKGHYSEKETKDIIKALHEKLVFYDFHDYIMFELLDFADTRTKKAMKELNL